mmetsp:Transcript_1626/g.5753  ORF Transcript_1626/g.5753 Transcript_1626/m.5753 type:complete len:745 (+) Transcript_1626:50-2284(+)
MSIRPSLVRFPVNGTLKDESGLPWGATVQPLSQEIAFSMPHEGSALATEIPRCERCFSYVNPFVSFVSSGWRCSLCGNENEYVGERYSEASLRRTLPEVSNAAIDYQMEPCPMHRSGPGDPDTDRAVFLAVVDLSGSDNGTYLQKVKDCLVALLEAIPESALFGLVTFTDRVGVWDLRNDADRAPHVSHLPIPADYECYVSIDQLIDFEQFLVPVGENLVGIMEVVDQLADLPLRTNNRGLGATIQLLVEYFNLYDTLSARMLVFAGGAANYGIGAIPSSAGAAPAPPKVTGLPHKGAQQPGQAEATISPATPFYRDLAKSAVDSGLCIDLFYFPLHSSERSGLGLSSTKFLSMFTGGNVSIYDSHIASETSAAKDVYRRYSGPLAFHSLLRLRTSPEFAVGEMYGHLQADPSYDDLYHMQGCDKWKTFAVDFEFTSPSGFYRMSGSRRPTLQMAFAYSYLAGKGEQEGERFVERRLRIHTIQLDVTSSHGDLYAAADSAAVMALLVHKIGRIALDESVKEAKLYLQDWMTIVYSRYNERVVIPSAAVASGPGGARETKHLIRATNMDLHFHKYPGMKPVPRLVFALLKSPLLSLTLHSDYWTYIHAFYTGCDPEALRLLIYPRMAAYGAVNNLSHDNVHLSQTWQESAGNHLFLLDAFSNVYIYFDAQSTEQFPPAKETLMWKHATAEVDNRFITPKVNFVRAGSDEEAAFKQLLIEDVTRSGMSYTHFLEVCSRAVVEMAKR